MVPYLSKRITWNVKQVIFIILGAFSNTSYFIYTRMCVYKNLFFNKNLFRHCFCYKLYSIPSENVRWNIAPWIEPIIVIQ